VYSLLNELNNIKNNEFEIVNEFPTRFERLLQRIPEESNHGERYLIFLYTRAFLGELRFLLNDREPRMIQEAYHIATKIEANISSPMEEYFSTPEVKVDNPKDSPDTD
jgi:hypothetical protein